ncbi:MAG: ABC transporter ATP-binding protein, partial [bacterium]|nr:ABC transporter ATP-binding protein [bacterium]
VNDPEILFADEPTGNLDSASSEEIMALFTELNGRGRTVVVVTHDPEVARYADRVVTIQDGQIVSDEVPAQRREPGARSENGGTSEPDPSTREASI